MKNLFLLPLVVFSLNAFDVNTTVIGDKVLKREFSTFWKSFDKKNYKKMYLIEAPYFRYLYSFDDYRAYYKNFKKIDVVAVDKIIQDGGKYTLKLKLSIGNKDVYFDDIWLRVNKKVFHKTDDIVLFKD